MSFDMLVEGFTECKIRVPSFEGPIKGVMGWPWKEATDRFRTRGRNRSPEGPHDHHFPTLISSRQWSLGPHSSTSFMARVPTTS